MARIIIELKEKTKAEVVKKVKSQERELGRKSTIKEVLLAGVGLKDE